MSTSCTNQVPVKPIARKVKPSLVIQTIGWSLAKLRPGFFWLEVRGEYIIVSRRRNDGRCVIQFPSYYARVKSRRTPAARRQHRQPSDECA